MYEAFVAGIGGIVWEGAVESRRRVHTIDRPRELEYRMVDAQGRVVWMRDLVSAVEGPAPPNLCGVMIDVTEQKRDRHEDAERLRLAVKSSNIGLWDWNVAAGTVIFSRDY